MGVRAISMVRCSCLARPAAHGTKVIVAFAKHLVSKLATLPLVSVFLGGGHGAACCRESVLLRFVLLSVCLRFGCQIINCHPAKIKLTATLLLAYASTTDIHTFPCAGQVMCAPNSLKSPRVPSCPCQWVGLAAWVLSAPPTWACSATGQGKRPPQHLQAMPQLLKQYKG